MGKSSFERLGEQIGEVERNLASLFSIQPPIFMLNTKVKLAALEQSGDGRIEYEMESAGRLHAGEA